VVWFCFVFLVNPMLPVSLNCPFLTTPVGHQTLIL
jgi:hypothetical protein